MWAFSSLVFGASILYFSRKLISEMKAHGKTRKELRASREQISFLMDVLARSSRGHMEQIKSNASPPQMSQAKIKKLLSLCHPDRHGNTAVSNEMTSWLLEQRR